MIDTTALRSKVIEAGIRGELTQRLPEDGNAEELLEQIQSEKNELVALMGEECYQILADHCQARADAAQAVGEGLFARHPATVKAKAEGAVPRS